MSPSFALVLFPLPVGCHRWLSSTRPTPAAHSPTSAQQELMSRTSLSTKGRGKLAGKTGVIPVAEGARSRAAHIKKRSLQSWPPVSALLPCSIPCVLPSGCCRAASPLPGHPDLKTNSVAFRREERRGRDCRPEVSAGAHSPSSASASSPQAGTG